MATIDELAKKIEVLESTVAGFKDTLKELQKNDVIQNPVHTKDCDLTWTEREKIEDIIRDFDFKKVHDVMDFLDWKWAMSKEGVPTIEELQAEARRLLVEAVTERTCVATGGFRAVYEADGADDEDPYIGLEFIVEECEGFAADEDEPDSEEDDYEHSQDGLYSAMEMLG